MRPARAGLAGVPRYAGPMKQRELEIDATRWTCVQALAGVTGAAADIAQRKMDAAQHVPVVCTPSGAAPSVRLSLAPDWMDSVSDAQLAQAITQAQHAAAK